MHGSGNTVRLGPPDDTSSIACESVLLEIDPGGRLDPGVRLRRFADEVESPPGHTPPGDAPRREKYRLLRTLGEGGMGTVYLAEDRDLRRRVALKVMKTKVEAQRARFLEEAQVLGQLDHPGIVAAHELGVADGARPFYTMRYIRGRALGEILNDLRRGNSAVSRTYTLTRLMQVLLQVTQAVAYAHARGVIHRDLKPANVMLGEYGEVQVVDWGLAKVLTGATVETDSVGGFTRVGQVVGTPAYMSPEQALGQPIDERADVWSLGVIFYQLLTLERPFEGKSSTEIVRAVVAQDPVPPRQRAPARAIPEALERACLRALEKEGDARFQSAAELVDAVQGWLDREADRERRHAAAEAMATEGRAKLESYLRLKGEIAALEAEVVEVAKKFRGWQPSGEKQELLAAEVRVAEARERLELEASLIVTTLGAALGFDPAHSGARELLADYYWDQLKTAEERGETTRVRFYGKLISEYHDGKYARELAGDGSLALDSDPPGAEVFLYEHVEEGFVLVPRRERRLGTTPAGPVDLAMGSYLVVLKKEGYRDVCYPVHITRNREWRGKVNLYTDDEIGPGAILVPAGPFVQGGDSGSLGWDLPRTEPWVDDFFISEHPVTAGEYLEFLNDLVRREGIEAAERRAPRPAAQAPTRLVRSEGQLRLPEVDAEGDRWEPRQPALGISWFDAVAYCEWRSEREGREYRLATATEWEKAARGVDGRWFPWGSRFDPSLCNMRESRRERPTVVAVEEFPTDVSVYGVRGMGGNVRDWTGTEAIEGEGDGARVARVVRGGAWSLNRLYARCANPFTNDATYVSVVIGFRLCAPARRLSAPRLNG